MLLIGIFVNGSMFFGGDSISVSNGLCLWFLVVCLHDWFVRYTRKMLYRCFQIEKVFLLCMALWLVWCISNQGQPNTCPDKALLVCSQLVPTAFGLSKNEEG